VLQPENDVLMGLYRRALLSRASMRISQDVGSRCVGPNEPIGQVPSTDAGTSVVALRAAAQRAREFAHNTPAPIGAELIDQVLDDVRVLATTYPLRLTADVVAELVVTQDRLFALLSRRHTPATARQLLFAAGVLGGMLANACLDLGDSPAASCQAHAAFVSADQAGHDGLRAWVRGIQALIAYRDGRQHQSVRYAQSGGEFARRRGNSTAVWLAGCEARGWSGLGNAEAARHALGRAERAWDGLRPDDLDALGGVCETTRAEQNYYAADALSWFPEHYRAARRYCDQALAGYRDVGVPGWDFGCAACSRAVLAITLAAEGAIAEVAAVLAPVLVLPPSERIVGVLQSVGRVAGALRDSALPGAGDELREQLRIFATGA
jgi:hypothetical protein